MHFSNIVATLAALSAVLVAAAPVDIQARGEEPGYGCRRKARDYGPRLTAPAYGDYGSQQ